MIKAMIVLVLAFVLPLAAQAVLHAVQDRHVHWRQADWSSAGLAPDPSKVSAAVVQVYAARAYRWRGIFGVHSWIAFKEEGAADYVRYDVMGWGRALRESIGPPDGRWAGNIPQILFEARGPSAGAMIPRIRQAIANYPHAENGSYVLWPGPNSNTFIATIARQVPELKVSLPSLAIGKDYTPRWFSLMKMPSGTGWQFSFAGYGGAGVAALEGLELHAFGQTLGVDILRPALKLPGIGRLGMSRPQETP